MFAHHGYEAHVHACSSAADRDHCRHHDGRVRPLWVYAAGMFVLVVMLIVPFLRSDPVTRHETAPAFRMTSPPELTRLSVSGSVVKELRKDRRALTADTAVM